MTTQTRIRIREDLPSTFAGQTGTIVEQGPGWVLVAIDGEAEGLTFEFSPTELGTLVEPLVVPAGTTDASLAYITRRRTIDLQVEAIRKRLLDFDAEQAARPRDWGFAGSAAEIESRLTSVLSALGVGDEE